MTTYPTLPPCRSKMLFNGALLMRVWCERNSVLPPPKIVEYEGTQPDFGTCAYYRDGEIHIWRDACARVGMVGRAWSCPGYTVDRTPYGVLAHELGHHVDRAHGARPGLFSGPLRAVTGELPITGYCDNDNEWFAEMFRVFVTNPTLLKELRPLAYSGLVTRWPAPAESRQWREVLAGYPRQIKAAENKIKTAIRSRPSRLVGM